MAFNRFKRPWRHKPHVSYSLEIDWSNPLARKLKHLFVLTEGDGPPLDLVTGEYLSNTVGAPFWGVDEHGINLAGDGNDAYWGAIPVYQHPVTIAAIGSKNNKTNGTTLLGLGQNASTGGLFSLTPRSSSTDDLRVYARTASGQPITWVAGEVGYNVNQNYFMAASVINANDLRLWIDGRYQGKETNNHGSTITWDRLTLMGLTRDSTTADHDGTVSFAAVWNTDFTNHEHASLAENPWQLLRPRRIPIQIVAAGTTIAATSVALSLTPLVTAVKVDNSIAAAVATLTITPYAATVAAGTNISAGVVALSITPLAATVAADNNIATTSAALSITPYSATIAAGTNTDIAVGVATLILTPNIVAIAADSAISAGSVALSLTAYNATISTGTTIAAGTVALAITPNAATVVIDSNIGVGVATLTLTPYAATITSGSGTVILADSATLAITTYAAAISYDRFVYADRVALGIFPKFAVVSLGSPTIPSSANSLININLGNVPQIDDPQVYEAVLQVHSAIEAILDYLNENP